MKDSVGSLKTLLVEVGSALCSFASFWLSCVFMYSVGRWYVGYDVDTRGAFCDSFSDELTPKASSSEI